MKTKKIIIGTLVAGVSMFFLGWLIYGLLLSGFMSENCTNTNARPMEQMIWWALIAANFASGLLIALVLSWSGNVVPSAGAKIGAILGFLIALAFDLSMYAMSTMYSSLAVIIVDSLAYSAMFAITGALTALVMNKVN